MPTAQRLHCGQYRPCDDDPSMVGDPVRVIDGAVCDWETDFRLPGATLPLALTRYYISTAAKVCTHVGRGFRHNLDVELIFDLDGARYIDGTGTTIGFPPLEVDGASRLVAGVELMRLSDQRYRVMNAEGQGFVFELRRECPGLGVPVAWVNDAGTSLELRYDVHRRRLHAFVVDAKLKVELHYFESPHGALLERALLVERATLKKHLLARYVYDEHGCLRTVEDAYRKEVRYSYDASHRVLTKTDRKGYTFSYTYDQAGRCVATRGQDGLEDLALDHRPRERTTVVTRRDGAVTTYYYDHLAQIRQVIAPDGGATVYPVDETGRISGRVDPRGQFTRYVHDAKGKLRWEVDPLGHWLAHPVDPSQHPLSHRIVATPIAWDFGDWANRSLTRLTAESIPVALPDAVTRALALGSQIPGPPQEKRDVQGVLTREVDELGRKRRHSYNGNGYPRWIQDFDGAVEQFHYGSWNHLQAHTDGLGQVTRFEYGTNDQVSAVIDPGGTRTDYGYDLCDRLTSVTRHGKVRERYTYDRAGNLTARLDAQHKPLLELTVGRADLVTKRSYVTGEVQHFEYDERGQMTVADGPDAHCTFAYAGLGRLREDMRDGRGVEHHWLGSIVVQTTVLGRWVIPYSRLDAATRKVVDPSRAVIFLRDHGHGVIERHDASGWHEVTQYDLLGRCLGRVAYRLGEPDQTWLRHFHYSGEGDLLVRNDSQQGTCYYQYDAAHRLTGQQLPDGRVESFIYDAGGNLQQAPGLQASFVAGNLLFAAHGCHFTHNERDHVSTRHADDGTTVYTYNGRDQLEAIYRPGLQYTALFDGLGRRIKKTVNGKVTRFYWDADRLAAEVGPRGHVRVYVYADEVARTPLAFVDYASLDAEPSSGRRYMVFCGHQSCPERVVDANGETVWAARIEAYGLAKVEVGAGFHQPLRWPGHYFDEETGLQDNRFRTYDPALGRYLQSDPIGLQGGLNVYAYTQNPLRDVDLRGYNGNANCAECQQAGTKCSACELAAEGAGVGGESGAAKGPIWSSTKKLTPVENALGHWNKHRSEFPEFANAKQYVDGTHEFVGSPPPGTLTKTSGGRTVMYHESSNTFAVVGADGAPRTMFRPDPAQHGYKTNLDYFDAQ